MAEAESVLTRIKKHQTIPFIDVGSGGTPDWARIGKSTIFDLALNPNTVTNDFIEDEMPSDDITSYQPKLPQELQTNKGDKAFDFVYGKFYDLPTGSEACISALIVFGGNAGTTEDPAKAWLCNATLILNNYNSVDEKISFDLNFGGTIQKGTVVITAGKPVFTASDKE